MSWMSPDSKFMQGVANLTDAIWVNILMLLTSIPVVTIGAALAAGHDANRRALAGQGHVTANYFRAFKENFAKSTALWAVYGIVGAALVCTWILLQITPLLIPKIAFTLLWIVGFEWTWALQARFSNSVWGTFKNGLIFGVSYFGTTLALVAIDAVFAALALACWFYLPQGLFLLLVLGYGTLIMLHIPLLERTFEQYTK